MYSFLPVWVVLAWGRLLEGAVYRQATAMFYALLSRFTSWGRLRRHRPVPIAWLRAIQTLSDELGLRPHRDVRRALVEAGLWQPPGPVWPPVTENARGDAALEAEMASERRWAHWDEDP